MSDDLISRQSAIDAVEKESQVDGAYGYMDTKSIVDLLNDLPSAQRTGRWIKADTHNYLLFKNDRIYKCSNCGQLLDFEEAGSSIILLPAGFDIAEQPAKWIDKEDPDYSGGGYSQCQNCGARFSWGAYHEPQEFRHCPTCGRRMEINE